VRERTIETYFTRRAIAAGCGVRKVKWIGRRDCPDRVLMIPQHLRRPPPRSKDAALLLVAPVLPATVWVELKRPREKPSSAQLREHTRMREYGQHVIVLCSIPQVGAFFDSHFPCAISPPDRSTVG
jgi:hypothetical protein